MSFKRSTKSNVMMSFRLPSSYTIILNNAKSRFTSLSLSLSLSLSRSLSLSLALSLARYSNM